MFKILGCLLLIVSSSLGGYYLSLRLKNRSEFLRDFIAFLKSLKIQLRYTSGDIFSVLPMCSDSKILKSVLMNISENRDENSLSEIWENSFAEISKQNGLKKGDVKALADFGLNLGTTDTQGQLSHIDLYTEIFLKALDNATEELKNKGKLYKTMGFFLGVSVSLMIV